MHKTLGYRLQVTTYTHLHLPPHIYAHTLTNIHTQTHTHTNMYTYTHKTHSNTLLLRSLITTYLINQLSLTHILVDTHSHIQTHSHTHIQTHTHAHMRRHKHTHTHHVDCRSIGQGQRCNWRRVPFSTLGGSWIQYSRCVQRENHDTYRWVCGGGVSCNQ